MTDYWEQEYLSSAELSVLDRVTDNQASDWITATLPFSGTKVDWERVDGDHRSWHFDDDGDRAAWATRLVCEELSGEDAAHHSGDSLSPWEVSIRADQAPWAVPVLLQIPEHHYFLAVDRSWLVAVTLEGDVDRLRPGQHR